MIRIMNWGGLQGSMIWWRAVVGLVLNEESMGDAGK